MPEDQLVIDFPLPIHEAAAASPADAPSPAPPLAPELPKFLPGGQPVRPRPDWARPGAAKPKQIKPSQARNRAGIPAGKKVIITSRGYKLVDCA